MPSAMRILPVIGILAAALTLGTALTEGGHGPALRADTAPTTTAPTPTPGASQSPDLGFSWG